jgi:hypothetical protein
MLSGKQLLSIVGAIVVVALVSYNHKELKKWFTDKDGFQNLSGLPEWAMPVIFIGGGVLLLSLYFGAREYVYSRQEKALNPFGFKVYGFENPEVNSAGRTRSRSASSGRTRSGSGSKSEGRSRGKSE